jgi:hypothetical protein
VAPGADAPSGVMMPFRPPRRRMAMGTRTVMLVVAVVLMPPASL